MASLKDKANEILTDKSTNLLPENIKKDTTILGVTGTLETLNTSDATATAENILIGKTAYVNGEKITGTMEDCSKTTLAMAPGSQEIVIIEDKITITGSAGNSGYIEAYSTKFDTNGIDISKMAEAAKITPDKIKKGETILGVTGTYEGN